MTPKSLLRAKEVVSRLEDMAPGSSFHRVIGESDRSRRRQDTPRRAVQRQGLLRSREGAREKRRSRVALVRIEQLYPFPFDALGKVLQRYRNAEVVWCQEEPENMGAWTFVDRRIEQVASGP